MKNLNTNKIKELVEQKKEILRCTYNSYEKEKVESLGISNSDLYRININPFSIDIETEDKNFSIHINSKKLTYDLRTYEIDMKEIYNHMCNLINLLPNLKHKIASINVLDSHFDKEKEEISKNFDSQIEELIYTDFENEFSINDDTYTIKAGTKYIYLYKNNSDEHIIKQPRPYFNQHFISYIIRECK